ncbi:MAG: hypothetical protein GOU98_02540 [Candidatus Altiarchaeota archaeon]|nr:hypothetical protein [Candidatus Altiarchaeota archaeon]
MDYGKEILAGLLFVAGFFLMTFNPVAVGFNLGIILGFIALVFFGALIQIAGLVNLKSYYLAPLVALGLFDIRAAGIFLFAFFGKANAKTATTNMIIPKMRAVSKAAYAGYLIFILVSVGAIYSQIEFKIPDTVAGFAVELLVPAIGCDPSYTGQECLDALVSETIDGQCRGNNACITLLNDQRPQLEESLFTQLSSQFIGFSRTKVIRDVLTDALNVQIESLIQPYQGTFKVLMAFVMFSVFQFLAGPLSSMSGIVASLLLRMFIMLKVVKKKTVKVEQIKFSI